MVLKRSAELYCSCSNIPVSEAARVVASAELLLLANWKPYVRLATVCSIAHLMDATEVCGVVRGGGNLTFLTLAHMLDATQVVWGGGGGGVGR